MLRYPYFCRIHKNFLSCWLESGIYNLGVWPKKIHATAERYNEYEAQEETDQTGIQELHRSQDRDSGVMTKLHIPVMVDEVVRCLAPQKGQVFLDMTFGSGGHTRAILQKEPDITLYALDRDPTAYAIAEQLSELYPKQIRAILGQFSQAEALLMKAGVQPGTLDGVLLDLGCSSMQLDTPERGFSLRKDGPLDMRMDGDRYPDMPTAADVVNALDQQALASILRAYGEEKHAKKIASAIIQARGLYPITRTQQLASIVADVQAGFRKGRGTRDQIANICWIIKKVREFQKNIYFCFIDYAKASDFVDHNKLWKILKEMGIPDHLTCLLRNLYRDTNRERSTSRLYIVTLLI
ncbi:12S rRNA N4-methylcytidine (m4C) methyltransferase isoform X2 [Bos javanicus]|uniref:12S rRNA N4-methylcytidine (m4C) methyltransferase isoform X2 n=1 Tax=Bos javanicus TaxID=9906 RepID=UPI002AA95618|nr:12S rRNA N4-methylcytidine (m4C) methyltransferase isoform X2 [Bos javanicus]